MKKLILGHGYLGGRVAARWVREGHEVFATTRSPEGAARLRGTGVTPLVADVLAPASLRSLPRADTVLWSIGFDRGAAGTRRDVYVGGLENILAALPKPGLYLHVSSTSVYGQSAGEEVDELSPTAPRDEAGRVMLEAEQLLRARLPEAVVLRFAGIYGPGRWLRERALRAGEPLEGDPDQWLNLIHVEDGAAVVLAAERLARPGEAYNVADDRPVRRRDFYGLMARLLNAPEPRFVQAATDSGRRGPDRGNRRIGNRKLRQELQVSLQFPTYEEGLRASQ